jgi:hypothetical protein
MKQLAGVGGHGADMGLGNSYDYQQQYSMTASRAHVHPSEHTNLAPSLSKPSSMSKLLDEQGMIVSGFWTPTHQPGEAAGGGAGGGGGGGGVMRSWAGAAASSPSSPSGLQSLLGGHHQHTIAPQPSYGGFTPGGAMARLAGQDLGIGNIMNDGIDDSEIADESFIVNWLGTSASPAVPEHHSHGQVVGRGVVGGVYAPSNHMYEQYQPHAHQEQYQPHQHQHQLHHHQQQQLPYNPYYGLQQQAPPPPQGSQSTPRVTAAAAAAMSAVTKMQDEVFAHRDDWNTTPSGN